MEILPDKTKLHPHLSEEQLEELERLSALEYTIEEMAMILSVDITAFIRAAEDPSSKIAYAIKKGPLASVAREQLIILAAAEGGNISASQHLATIKRNRGFKISKQAIFSGFENEKSLRIFEDWIQGGCKSKLSEEEDIYMEALRVMNSMDRKYGRRNTIEFFVKTYGLKQSRASEMYDEAINLFNSDRKIDKKAYRNKYADMLDDVALVLFQNLSGPKDADAIGNLKAKAGFFRGLNEADPVPLAKELFLRPVRYFSMDSTTVGIPTINRTKLARSIDEIDIPESDRNRIKADALLSQINIEQTFDELEEESRSQ